MYIFQQDSEFGDDENEEEEEEQEEEEQEGEEESKEEEYETESDQPLNTTSNNKVSDNEEEEEEDDSSEDDSTEEEDIATLFAPLKVYVAGTPDNGFNTAGIKNDIINFGGTVVKAKEVDGDGACNHVVLGGKTARARTKSVFDRITRNDLWRNTVNQRYIRDCINNRKLLPIDKYLINQPPSESINNVMYLYII